MLRFTIAVFNFQLKSVWCAPRRKPQSVLGPVWSEEKRGTEGCPRHCLGAASLSGCRQSGTTIVKFPGPRPFGASIVVSPREAEQGAPAAKLWDATLGGANRTSRDFGAYAERRRSHPSYAGKALLLASYGTGVAGAQPGCLFLGLPNRRRAVGQAAKGKLRCSADQIRRTIA